MNNSFDFRRFVQVLRLSWQNQPILPYVVLVGMIPLLLFFFVIDSFGAYVDLETSTPFFMFNLYLFACGWLYAGVAFSELGHSGSANALFDVASFGAGKMAGQKCTGMGCFSCH